MVTEFPGLDCVMRAIDLAGITSKLEGNRPEEPIHIPAADCPSLVDWLRNHNGQQTIVRPEADYLVQLHGEEIILFPRSVDDTSRRP